MKRLLVAVLLLLLAVPARAGDYPVPDGYVLDEGGFLGPGVEVRLERLLADYDRRTTNQVAVVLLHTLDGADPADYGFGLFNAWGIGTAADDNGALLLLAVEDRASRLQVGLGVEGLLTDDEAQHVLDDVLAPAARAGNLDAAVLRSVAAIRTELGEARGRAVAPAPADDPFHGGTARPLYADDVVDTSAGGAPVGPPYVDGPTQTFPQDSGFPSGAGVIGLAVLGVLVSGAVALLRGGSGGSGAGGTWAGSDDDSFGGRRPFGGLGGFGSRSGGFGGGSSSGSSSGSSHGAGGSSSGGFGGGSTGGGGASGSW